MRIDLKIMDWSLNSLTKSIDYYKSKIINCLSEVVLNERASFVVLQWLIFKHGYSESRLPQKSHEYHLYAQVMNRVLAYLGKNDLE